MSRATSDLTEEIPKEEDAKKASASDDADELIKKADERCHACALLVAKFESSGTLQEHKVVRGVSAGKVNYKQVWKHIHSGHEFLWHCQLGKEAFEIIKVWKAARTITASNISGTE